MNLTEEQVELLTKIADVYNSGCKANFRLVRVHNAGQSGLVFLNGGPTIPSDAVKEDFKQLAGEGFLQIDIEGAGLVEGKITAKGLMAAAAQSAASQTVPGRVQPPVPDRLPPPQPGRVNPPTPVRFSRPPKWEGPLVLQPTSEPPRPRQAVETVAPTAQPIGSKPQIFIGHGKRDDWLHLEKFLMKRGINCEEFNSESPAGMTTQDRLKDMVKKSVFAFLVMTAEDKQADGTFHARQNVVHEAGLCHGLLGWDKAILLLEEGCTKFSNGDGLTHIPFQAKNIKSAFHEIQELLESRGLIKQ